MDFGGFLEKQDGIYAKFRDTSKLKSEGLKPNIPRQQGGYLIAFRHGRGITDALGEFSHQVSRIVPAISYDGSNAHTTLSDFQVQDDFSPSDETLTRLSRAVHDNIPLAEGISITYNEWLLNQNTGISAGQPNQQFFETARRIVDYANQKDLQLRMAWGAHLTTNRFLEDWPAEETGELLQHFRTSKPLGESNPEYLDVGHFIFTPKGFEYHTHERFELQHASK